MYKAYYLSSSWQQVQVTGAVNIQFAIINYNKKNLKEKLAMITVKTMYVFLHSF